MNNLMDAIEQGKQARQEALRSFSDPIDPELEAPAEQVDSSTGEVTTPEPAQEVMTAKPTATFPDTKMGQWLQETTLLKDIALTLSMTGIVPHGLKKNPKNTHREVLAVILAGAEVGLSPIQALQNINYISGKPSLSALAMRGLVTAAGHQLWVTETDDKHAVVRAKRADNGREYESIWTMERAQQLGLPDKKDNKGTLDNNQWRLQPVSMLIARATSEVCRHVAPEVLMGIGYTAEELKDS